MTEQVIEGGTELPVADEAIDQVESTTPEPEVTEPVALAPEPIEYTDFAIPEGLALDGDVLEDYKSAAKECGLNQADAQKLIEFGSIAQAKALDKMSVQWEAQTRADKEFGGEKFDENLGIAGKAFDAFASPELKQLLATSKFGNHPEMIRAFYKIGKAMSEDSFVSGSRAPTSSQTAAEKLYGNKG